MAAEAPDPQWRPWPCGGGQNWLDWGQYYRTGAKERDNLKEIYLVLGEGKMFATFSF